jgi:hypothetical protein
MQKRAYSSNLKAAAAIILIILVGHAVAPNEFDTRMTCPGTDEVVRFNDLETCMGNPGLSFGCSCSRESSRAYYVITIGLLPMIAGAIGHFLTFGPLRSRLLFMNAAVVTGLFAQRMPALLQAGPEMVTEMRMLPILMVIQCIVVTIWFNLFARVFRRGGMQAIAAPRRF